MIAVTYAPWADFVHALFGIGVAFLIVRVVASLLGRMERRL